MTTAAVRPADHFHEVITELTECSDQREDCDACQRKPICIEWFDGEGTAVESNTYIMKEPRAVKIIGRFNIMIKQAPVNTCPFCNHERTHKHYNRFICPKCKRSFGIKKES